MNYLKLIEQDIKEQNEVEVCREMVHLVLELLGYIRIGKAKKEGVEVFFTDKWGGEETAESISSAINAMTVTMAKAVFKIGRIAELRRKNDFFSTWSDEQIENLCDDIMSGKVD